MTREKEINKEAISRCKGDSPMVDIARGNFRAGAKWADRTMLDKVCEWLSDIDFDSDYFRDAEDYFNNDRLVEEFRKAMEE